MRVRLGAARRWPCSPPAACGRPSGCGCCACRRPCSAARWRWPAGGASRSLVLGRGRGADRGVAGPAVGGPRAGRGRAAGPRRRRLGSLAALVVSLVLLLIFGGLLAGADAVFASRGRQDPAHCGRWRGRPLDLELRAALPRHAGRVLPGRRAARLRRRRRSPRRRHGAACGAARVGSAGRRPGAAVRRVRRRPGDRPRLEGDEHVLRTAGLTYAEYARQGFWQLLAVTVLTLLVMAVAARLAAPGDRRRTGSGCGCCSGLLALLTLVIVASALSRMWPTSRRTATRGCGCWSASARAGWAWSSCWCWWPGYGCGRPGCPGPRWRRPRWPWSARRARTRTA